MTVLRQFTPSQLEIVAKARQSGLLTRLQKEPEVLMLRVSEEADSARRGAVEETKRLAEDEMLASIWEMLASIRQKRSANARAASGALRGVLQESEDEEEKDKASPVRGHSRVDEAAVREAGQAGDTAPLGDDDTDETDRRRNKEEGSYIYHQQKKKEDLWENSWGGDGLAAGLRRGSGGIAWERWDPGTDYPIVDPITDEITGYWVPEKRASPITTCFRPWQKIDKSVYDRRIRPRWTGQTTLHTTRDDGIHDDGDTRIAPLQHSIAAALHAKLRIAAPQRSGGGSCHEPQQLRQPQAQAASSASGATTSQVPG